MSVFRCRGDAGEEEGCAGAKQSEKARNGGSGQREECVGDQEAVVVPGGRSSCCRRGGERRKQRKKNEAEGREEKKREKGDAKKILSLFKYSFVVHRRIGSWLGSTKGFLYYHRHWAARAHILIYGGDRGRREAMQ
jgi:hypothetical protein